MALIKCSKCGEKISDKAKVCPHCGKVEVVEKIKKKSDIFLRKTIFIISMIISFIVFGFGAFLLASQIIGLPKLNYPLTGIIPILELCSAIGFSIMFPLGMFKWQKKEKAKKQFKTALFLLIGAVVLYIIASPINIAIRENEIGYRNQGVSTYSVKGLSYDIPNKWTTEETDGGYYHYPYIENSDGLLYVYSEYDGSYNEYYYENKEQYYKEFMEGMKSSDVTGYFKILSQESINIAGNDGFKSRYKTILGDKYYECEQYMLLDSETNTIYVFTFGIKDSIPKNMKESFSKIIDSVKER